MSLDFEDSGWPTDCSQSAIFEQLCYHNYDTVPDIRVRHF